MQRITTNTTTLTLIASTLNGWGFLGMDSTIQLDRASHLIIGEDISLVTSIGTAILKSQTEAELAAELAEWGYDENQIRKATK